MRRSKFIAVCNECRKLLKYRLALCKLMSAAVLAGQSASAAIPDKQLCDWAALQAASEFGVPVEVLQAITRTETGRRRGAQTEPWPWTVNMEGAGHWFEDRNAALEYVMRNFQRGARSFDVGCYQINYRWHGQHFANIDTMFDPLESARYAARFLADLYEEKGNWTSAAGAYHSRTPRFAERYAARFERFLAQLPDQATNSVDRYRNSLRTPHSGAQSIQTADAIGVRRNGYPLLQSGGRSLSLGSLVRLDSGVSGRALIEQ